MSCGFQHSHKKQTNKQRKERNQRSESQNRGTLDCSSKRGERENEFLDEEILKSTSIGQTKN
jgi:hypothetical protein